MGVRFLSGTAFFDYKNDKQEKERKKVMGMARKPKSQGNEFLNKLKEDKMFAGIVFGGAAVILVIVIILISVLIKGGKDEKPEKIAAANEQQTEVSENEVTTPEVVDDGSLMENAYEQVNSLVNEYFTALAAGDKAKVQALKSDTNEEELIKIEKKSAYINGFENIKVYTKLGQVDNSYIVFVYYDINFADMTTLVPGLTTIYVCQSDDGSLHIYDGELDEATSEYIKGVAAQDDVVDLFNRVEVSYNEAIESDEALKKFMDELPTKLDTEVAQAMADLEAQAQQAAANEQQTEETSEPQDGGQTETVEATDTVNVRKSDSENADKLGKLEIGTRVTRFEARENGWSRVEYNGGEGFVKSEYLKVVSAETASENTDNSASEPASSEGVSTSGTIGIKETVNVRESAGEDAKKIGVAYENEHYKLIMKQADGWSKIDFNGKIGFVKSEYVTFE